MTPSSHPERAGVGAGAPPPLTVAASLTAVEAMVLIGLGVFQIPGLHGEKLAMNASTLLFFVVYGGFLGYCALQLYRRNSWSRAPVVLAQLIQILIGASFWGGATTAVAVVTVLVGLVTIAGVFHPASLAALEEAD